MRPILCSTEADFNVPSFCSCAAVNFTSVSGDMRKNDPSGNWMAACPPVPVWTVLPGLRASPAIPGLLLTSTGWLITVKDAEASTAA